MAKPNYSYEKRQKELAKKKKQEEKQEEKRLKKAASQGERPQGDSPQSPVGETTAA